MAPFVRLQLKKSQARDLGLHLVGQTAALHGAQMAMEVADPQAALSFACRGPCRVEPSITFAA